MIIKYEVYCTASKEDYSNRTWGYRVTFDDGREIKECRFPSKAAADLAMQRFCLKYEPPGEITRSSGGLEYD